MIDEILPAEKWLFLYSLPCHFGRQDVFRTLMKSEDFKPVQRLEGDYSRENVRNYFLGKHNDETISEALRDSKWYNHLLIPYSVILNASLYQDMGLEALNDFSNTFNLPFILKKTKLSKRQRYRIRRFGLGDPNTLSADDIVYLHNRWVVDIEKKDGQS